MCEFCKEIDEMHVIEDGYFKGQYLPEKNINQIVKDGDNFHIWSDGGGDCFQSGVCVEDIDYCPKCGRKLTEEQPMFEVIYISPSCNQALGFIYAVAVRLKEIGITDFKIDREHLQLTTDKFIVSAVSISVGCLGVSIYPVEYYIDKVTNADYPCERARENAMERLKCLRCRFREDTKEILEEELIEILREV